jgi:hypothetical protein
MFYFGAVSSAHRYLSVQTDGTSFTTSILSEQLIAHRIMLIQCKLKRTRQYQFLCCYIEWISIFRLGRRALQSRMGVDIDDGNITRYPKIVVYALLCLCLDYVMSLSKRTFSMVADFTSTRHHFCRKANRGNECS